MYAELKMELKTENLTYKKSSNLQGVIMEHIDPDYASVLHRNQQNPYSQCLIHEKDKCFWYIRTITREAYENLILPMSELKSFGLKNINGDIMIGDKTINLCAPESLLEEFYQVPGPRFLNIEFQTPTSFKTNDQYVNYPDLRLIYSSLMRKYSAASNKIEMFDDETLDQLVSYSKISRYRLRTIDFPLEATKITGFCGNLSIYMRGTNTMARYARLLLKFGRYSGIGIKSAMGMGAVRFIERGEESD